MAGMVTRVSRLPQTLLTASLARRDLRRFSDPTRAKLLQRFFQTGPGEYGEGDRFLGLTVPVVRGVARTYRELPLREIGKLLASEFHEERLLALLLLVHRAQRADASQGRRLADFFLRNRKRVNNWDLVDLSARYLLGPFLEELSPILDRLANSPSVWDRRIAILSHMHDLGRGGSRRSFPFAARFLNDEHDLIHKAVGWLLREAGKSDPAGLHRFLKRYATRMPRTMLRYAIERLSPAERQTYMARPTP